MNACGKFAVQALALLAVAFLVMVFFAPLVCVKAEAEPIAAPQAETETVPAQAPAEPTEYQRFVHTYTSTNSTQGTNSTSVDKPMFPIYFNDTQIAIGESWSVIEPLEAGHNYHVYMYGAYVNNGSEPKTDYDIYVYNPKGLLESEHTEAAGLPEHLGTRVNDTFFTPATTGNYKFVIINHEGESNGTQQATFMAIENVETNQWFSAQIAGKQADGQPAYNTSWAYEFVTDQPQIGVYVQVPVTLDMYEARLYVMSDPESLVINNAPLPWEPGLYGNLTGNVGGYSLDSVEYRGVAYASCEYKGQDMQLNYRTNATSSAKTLYHLVLIGEAGAGKIDCLIKTQFDNITLIPTNTTTMQKPSPENPTTLTYASNLTALQNAALTYTVDHWNTTILLPMKTENKTCTATIPPQKIGTVVEYKISANDTLQNSLCAQGNFTIKQHPTLNITAPKGPARIGENVTIQGTLIGAGENAPVILQFMSAKETVERGATTMANGSFAVNFYANGTGEWAVQASFPGDATAFPAFGNQLVLTVEDQPFYVKNGVFIGGGGFFGVVALSLGYYIKKRRQ